MERHPDDIRNRPSAIVCCGKKMIAIISEWEDGDWNNEPILCRSRRCWLCGKGWNEVLSEDDAGMPMWIWDGDHVKKPAESGSPPSSPPAPPS